MSNQSLWVTLSQLLIAFTIELDNEWEQRYWIPADPKPLRTSLVMWTNFLRFVAEEGITVELLSQKAGYAPKKIHPDLAGMIRWRYVTVSSSNPKKPKLHDIVRPTGLANEAAEVWKPLVGEIEDRWVDRFGQEVIEKIKQALVSLITAFDKPLPHYYPVLAHTKGMFTLVPHQPDCDQPETLALPYLASQAHHLFTMAAERDSEISLAIRSNVMRVIDVEPIEFKALPQLTGISKEALSMSLNWLKKREYAVEAPNPAGRGKVVRLTDSGKWEQDRYPQVMAAAQETLLEIISDSQLEALREALVPFVKPTKDDQAPLFEGLNAAPGLWRAKGPPRSILPHHPMVLYRGGWPDGS